MSEEHNIYHLPTYNPLAASASVTHVHPQIITMHVSAAPAASMTISISEYNSLLKLHDDLMSAFMNRGDEITRLQVVVRNVAHYLDAKRDVQGELSAVEDALRLECERAMEGKAE